MMIIIIIKSNKIVIIIKEEVKESYHRYSFAIQQCSGELYVYIPLYDIDFMNMNKSK